MNFKTFGSLAFLLLTLQCYEASAAPRLDCGTKTPTACIDQFKQEFSKTLQSFYTASFQKLNQFFIDMIKEVSTSKQTEEALLYFSDFDRRAESTTTLSELFRLWEERETFERAHPDVEARLNEHFSIKQIMEKEKAIFTEFCEEIANATLELFAGLRPRDYEQFEEMRHYENKFKQLKEKPSEGDRYLVGDFSQYLDMPVND